MINSKPISIGGIKVSPLSMEQSVSAIMNIAGDPQSKPCIVTAINAHFVVTAQRESRLKEFLNGADLCLADGASLVFASRLFRTPIPERVTGIDLMVRLCAEAAKQSKSVYLLGGGPGAAEKAAEALSGMYPGLRIAGADRPTFGHELERAEANGVRERISAARPDFLFVCFGVPLQEYWIRQWALDLPVRVVMGNGAAFDVLGGFFKRPPQYLQRMGLEWLCRLLAEPRRLWRRYLIGNSEFIAIVLGQFIAGYLGPPLRNLLKLAALRRVSW